MADFGRLVVQAGLLDARFGRALNGVQKLRELSDYLGDPPSTDDAASALAEAEAFVAAILGKPAPIDSKTSIPAPDPGRR